MQIDSGLASKYVKVNFLTFSANITGVKNEEVLFPVFMKLLHSGEIQAVDTFISRRPSIKNMMDNVTPDIISNAVNNPTALTWLGTTRNGHDTIMIIDISEFCKEMHSDVTPIESDHQECGEGNSNISSTDSRGCFTHCWIINWHVTSNNSLIS